MIVLSKKEAGPLPHAPTRPYPNPGRDPVSAFISSPTVTGPGAYVRTFGLLFSALRLVAGPRSSQQRKQRKNQDQDRINFQTSCRHGKGQDQPGECGKRRKAACWTAYSKSRSHITDAGIGSRDGALEILTIQSHENLAYGNQDKPEAEECKSLRDFLSRHRLAPESQGFHFLRMCKFLDVQLQGPEHNQDPHHFHAAACASGHGLHHHQKEQDHSGKRQPETEIRCCVPGGGHDRDNLERCMAISLGQTSVKRQDVQCHQKNGSGCNPETGAKFRTPHHRCEFTDHQEKVQLEIDAKQKHEHGDHGFEIHRIGMGNGICIQAEVVGPGGAEGMHQGPPLAEALERIQKEPRIPEPAE